MLGLNPLLGLVAGYAALIAVTLRLRGAVKAVAVMILVYLAASVPPWDAVYGLARLAEWNNLRVFVFIAFSLYTAALLREKGVLQLIVRGVSSLSCRAAMVLVPSIVGMLPMPGGALVSAMALRDTYERAGVGPEWATYLNYWFRHVLVPAWPLFQSVVITAAVLHIDPMDVVAVTWPVGLLAVLGGLLVSAPVLRREPQGCDRSGSPLDLLRGLWPFILIVVLALETPLGLLGSLVLTALLVTLVYRPSGAEIRRILGFALKPQIHAVLFEALYMKELLLATDAPHALAEALAGLPVEALVYLIPFIMGLGAGGENFFAATAMPLLYAFLVLPGGGLERDLLVIAYAGGYLGVMASPVHLCFALTVEYFRASPGKTMLLVLAAIAATTALVYMLVLGLA